MTCSLQRLERQRRRSCCGYGRQDELSCDHGLNVNTQETVILLQF